MRDLSTADLERRHGVRRMKAVAAAFLLAATVVYIVARLLESRGAAWTGYVEAAAEAGMVGGLADWFAVTALFRHPLGIPIPHTAIIPSRKDALGRGLSDFVGENFLAADVVRRRLRTVGVARRVGVWLAEPSHVERLTDAAASLIRSVVGTLRDEDLRSVIGPPLLRRLEAIPVGPPLGGLLGRIVAEGSHHGIVTMLGERAYLWVAGHRDVIERIVAEETPRWSPKMVDRGVAGRLHRELLDFTAAVRDKPDHEARQALDAMLADVAERLRTDPETAEKAERIKRQALASPELNDLIASVSGATRAMVVDAVGEPDGEVRQRLRAGVVRLGERLTSDQPWTERLDTWVEDAVVAIVEGYRDEITSLITDTIATWDATETSRRIELHVGRDLQFIRINGTVVGAVAGLLIYTLSHLG